MTEPIPTGKITSIVEQACQRYKKGLGGVGDPLHQDTEHLRYVLATGQHLDVELSYVSMCSSTGFPFNRINTTLRLDGKRITKVQLISY
jgi:hypothetical protein